MRALFTLALGVIAGTLSHTSLKAKPVRSADSKSLLWRISSKTMTKPSYLFGTIHIICAADYLWTAKMQETLSQSDEVCFEMDMDDPALMMQIATGLVDKSGKKLEDYFTAEQYTRLSNYIRDSMGMNINMFQSMKPTALPSLFAGKTTGCDSTVSYEDKIMTAAHKDKKTITGLEEAQEQIALFDNLPADSVVSEIMDAIENKGDDKETYQQLVQAYKMQDLPALYALILKSKEMGDDMDAFLDERNKKWISRMVDKMDQKSIFFAVGAGHLWGDNGVISLLRKQGYTVEAVK